MDSQKQADCMSQQLENRPRFNSLGTLNKKQFINDQQRSNSSALHQKGIIQNYTSADQNKQQLNNTTTINKKSLNQDKLTGFPPTSPLLVSDLDNPFIVQSKPQNMLQFQQSQQVRDDLSSGGLNRSNMNNFNLTQHINQEHDNGGNIPFNQSIQFTSDNGGPNQGNNSRRALFSGPRFNDTPISHSHRNLSSLQKSRQVYQKKMKEQKKAQGGEDILNYLRVYDQHKAEIMYPQHTTFEHVVQGSFQNIIFGNKTGSKRVKKSSKNNQFISTVIVPRCFRKYNDTSEDLSLYRLVENGQDNSQIQVRKHLRDTSKMLLNMRISDCSESFVLSMLTNTEQYSSWWMPCSEVTSLNETTDILSYSKKEKSWFGLREKSEEFQIIRCAFRCEKSQRAIVGFGNGEFQIIVRFTGNQNLIIQIDANQSNQHQEQLLKAFQNFKTRTEIQWHDELRTKKEKVGKNQSSSNHSQSHMNMHNKVKTLSFIFRDSLDDDREYEENLNQNDPEESSIQGHNAILSPLNDESQLMLEGLAYGNSKYGVDSARHLTGRISQPSNTEDQDPLPEDDDEIEQDSLILQDQRPPELLLDSNPNDQLLIEDNGDNFNQPVELNGYKGEAETWDHNGGRPRECRTALPIEEYKNKEGVWTRWIVERLTPEQLQIYEEMKNRLKDEPICAHYSDNYRIRFLAGSKFNLEKALEGIVRTEKYRVDAGWRNLRQSDFQILHDRGFCCLGGHDKDGRSIIYQRCRYFNCEGATVDQMEYLMCYFMDYACSSIKPNSDGIVVIFDLEGCGYANMYKDHMIRCLKVCQEQFVCRTERLLVMNSSWTTRTIYGSMTPFLSERAKQKVQFLPPAPECTQILLNQIPSDQLTSDYGGTGPSLSEIVPQKYPDHYP